MPFSLAPGGGGITIITLGNSNTPFVLPPAASNGTNIVIITFNAQLLPDIALGCPACVNEADLTHYSSQHGGPNFVSAGFTPPFSDTAEIDTCPILEKSVVSASEPHTTPQDFCQRHATGYHRRDCSLPVAHDVAAGGCATKILSSTDNLPPGMKYIPGSAAIAFIAQTGIARTSFLGIRI